MELRKLISRAPLSRISSPGAPTANPEIRDLAYDSRQVGPGTLFFAIEGEVTDGHRFIEQALERGAVAIASERDPTPGFSGIWVQLESIRPAMAELANEFFGNPSHELRLAGLTGTNGKTTTAFLVHSILTLDGPALLAGTIKTLVGAREQESRHTTPEAIDIQRMLRAALDEGCRSGVMEVSSHALALARVYRCFFPVAVFTNLTQDHLDFHGSLEEYFKAKLSLFDQGYNPGLEHALINADDAFGARISASSTRTYGLRSGLDIYPLERRTSLEGTDLTLSFFGRRLRLKSSLVGGHNLYNLMAASGAASLLGAEDSRIQEGIATLRQVPGRFEKVDVEAGFSVIVDYAHTPDALENVLRLSREVSSGRVICVFGCGGDRDRKKRPLMGSIATNKADHVIVTSDNPRSEEPGAIIAEIVAGIGRACDNYEVIEDRRQAIKRSLDIAKPGDLVLIAGKGHETYQIVKGVKSHFDDREVVKELL
jgi:UDP-N-acetylmuramoyl-L-alanyl-D-glutamate--2,6-diaminopimelate ligase